MANETSNQMKLEYINAFFAAGTYRIILMNMGFTFDLVAHSFLSVISANELPAGNGYSTGGIVLSGKTIAKDDVNNRAFVSFNDISFTAAGGPIGPTPGAIIYKDTGIPSTSPVVSWKGFNGDVTKTDGFSIQIQNIEERINRV